MSLRSSFPQPIKNFYHFAAALTAAVRYRYPARHLEVIGVTGTDGKTTTATLIYHLLKTAGVKVALISTVAAYIGPDRIDTGFHVTSPDPHALQRLLSKIYRSGFTHVVLEATSHGLDQHRLLLTHVRYAVVTNITPEHLDYHRTFDRYLRAKGKLLRHARLVVLNTADPSFTALSALVPRTATLLTYSLTSGDSWQPLIEQRFPQPYNQANALAAVTLVTSIGVPSPAIAQGLSTFPGVPGRLHCLQTSPFQVIIDFAHTPNALKEVLTAVRSQTPGKLIAVFGAAGRRDRQKRPLMAQLAAQLADEVVLTAEDPRGEDPRLIIRQMLDGLTHNHGHVHALIDRRQAIGFALTVLAQPHDTVMVLGKGHERSMNLDGRVELPWSDAAVARSFLNSK